MKHKSEYKILIVDDIAENIKVAANFLRKYGYNISFAMDGEQALKKAGQINFDLILLDIMLPDTEGYDVCLKLKEQDYYKDVPVIFLTARADIQSIVKGFESGGADYITKPFNGHELYQRVRNQLDLREARNELARKNEHLLRANKTRDLLMSMMSHDLLGPLSTAAVSTESIARGEVSLSERDMKSFMLSLHESLKSISTTMENVLLWARSQKEAIQYDIKQLNISLLADKMVNFLQPMAARKGINLYSNLLEDYYVQADANTVEVIIRNLLNNALKYTPTGGEVSVDCSFSENACHLNVKDNGKGMSSEEIGKIFSDQHYSTWGTKREKGFGLGLEISRLFAARNNGKLYCVSEPGKGSTFTLELPVSKDPNKDLQSF